MTETSELVVFLIARLHEWESYAVAADRRRWRRGGPESPYGPSLSVLTAEPGIIPGPPWRTDYAEIARFTGARGPDNALHAAVNDPSHVLDDIEAKWRVLARHRPCTDDLSCNGCGFDRELGPMVEDIENCPELRDMAVAFRTHPDYKTKWHPV